MSIRTIDLNVADISRSIDFYTKYLGAQIVGDATDERADLDFVTVTLRLSKVVEPETSTWIPDDLQKGFRHIGFKVAKVDPMVEILDADGIEFHLRPLDAEGEVRITFFFDPDGTLVELVEGDLQYHDVASEEGVQRERALGIPERPRFDHVAVTAADFSQTRDFYAPFGFEHIGSIHQVHDPRGFEIDYLKGGDTVLEVFTYAADKIDRPVQLKAPGFSSVGLETDAGEPVFADSNGFAFHAAP
jgi:catechol 2,3-dioxygenase-like lactoylglutathione lyase family enzyme